MKLLVAIPCLNEAETIAGVIGQVPRTLEGLGQVRVLVVDDGSSDNTGDLAAACPDTDVIRHGINRGVGTALHTAINYALENGFDLMVNIDGDGQFDPADIARLVGPVLSGEAQMATASRFKDPSLVPAMPTVKRVGNRMMSALISRLCGREFHDVSCGFRCYSREALLQLNLHGHFTYTQETFIDLVSKGLTIAEVPVRVRYFDDRRSRVAASILNYARRTSLIIIKIYRDYFPLRFFLSISAVMGVIGSGFGAIFIGHFLATGQFSGYLFAGFLSGFFLTIAMLFLILGIVADMLDRIRLNQERALYLMKRKLLG